jgi:tetratricopeptide (TPR) repeat protein
VFHRFRTLEYVRIKGGTSSADNAHNYLLQLASGIGIPGLLIFCAIFVWAGVRSFTTVFRRSDDPSRLILGAFWAASVGYLVHLFVGLSLPGTTFLLWTALAIVLVPTARSVEVKALRWGTAVAVAVIVIAAAGIGYQGAVLAADNAYLKAQTAESTTERVEEALRAVRLNPLNADYREGVGLAYLAEMRAYLQAGGEAHQKGEDTTPYEKQAVRSFVNAKSALEEAIEFIPAEYDNYVVLATLYNLGGRTMDENLYQSAIDVAEQGLEIEPLGTTIRVQLAQSLVDPKGGEAALHLASLYRQLGHADRALEVLRSVEALAPGQPGIAEAIKELEAEASAP